MILRDYETVANEFFGWLASAGEKGQALFQEMNFVRLMKSAREQGQTVDEHISRHLGGQISICDEYLNQYRMACDLRDASANAERDGQFLKGGLGVS